MSKPKNKEYELIIGMIEAGGKELQQAIYDHFFAPSLTTDKPVCSYEDLNDEEIDDLIASFYTKNHPSPF